MGFSVCRGKYSKELPLFKLTLEVGQLHPGSSIVRVRTSLRSPTNALITSDRFDPRKTWPSSVLSGFFAGLKLANLIVFFPSLTSNLLFKIFSFVLP